MMIAIETVGAPTCAHPDLTTNPREQMMTTILDTRDTIVEAEKKMTPQGEREIEAVAGMQTRKTRSKSNKQHSYPGRR
jgi:hypothetical protein